MWNGFWCYRYLLWNLVSRDFKLKYRRSVLGVVWSVLNPLLMCLVYWAVFSSLMDMRGSGIDNFAVFLMCGQLLFNFFNEATSTGMSSVLGAAPLLKKVYIPKDIFPLEKCCFAMVSFISSQFPCAFSQARPSVITLVMDAGCSSSFIFCCASTRPVSASMMQ
jgi:ABC-2 type transport system permease protein